MYVKSGVAFDGIHFCQVSEYLPTGSQVTDRTEKQMQHKYFFMK
jgi:hypothetical protein